MPCGRASARPPASSGSSTTPPRGATGAFQQRLTETFGIVLAVRELSDPKGGQAVVSIGAVRRAVRESLAGWQPDEHHEPVEFATGGLVDLSNGVLWWLDQYRVRTWWRKVG